MHSEERPPSPQPPKPQSTQLQPLKRKADAPADGDPQAKTRPNWREKVAAAQQEAATRSAVQPTEPHPPAPTLTPSLKPPITAPPPVASVYGLAHTSSVQGEEGVTGAGRPVAAPIPSLEQLEKAPRFGLNARELILQAAGLVAAETPKPPPTKPTKPTPSITSSSPVKAAQARPGGTPPATAATAAGAAGTAKGGPTAAEKKGHPAVGSTVTAAASKNGAPPKLPRRPPPSAATLSGKKLLDAIVPAQRPFVQYNARSCVPRVTRQAAVDVLLGQYLGLLVEVCVPHACAGDDKAVQVRVYGWGE